MNHPSPRPDKDRFSGGLRHYHRAGGQPQRTWDDWVEGSPAEGKRRRNWWKIIGWAIGLMALAGIIAGLIIELR